MTTPPFPNLIRPPPPELSAEQFLEHHLNMLMTDENCARLRGLLEDRCAGPIRLSRKRGFAAVGHVGPDAFRELVGRDPVDDELDRLNCTQAGTPGHRQCGWCDEHEMPRWECGCLAE